MILRAADVVAFHDGRGAVLKDPLWAAIDENHRHNCKLWEEEDLARRRDVPDSAVAENKRAIDRHNQKRHDALERIDELLLSELGKVARMPDARLNSETAGSIIDRLSILSLKTRAMRTQSERREAGPEHVAACRAKLTKLIEQRDDLAGCLDRLLAECARGESYYKLYRQFKMYNDPQLNPALYGEKKGR